MEIKLYDDRKCVEIWMTNAEQSDSRIRAQLSPIFAEYKQKGYLTAVFLSGDQDLYQQTAELLKYNRKCSAEREVQCSKVKRE